MLNLRLARSLLILLSFVALVSLPVALASGFQLTVAVIGLGPLGVAEFGVVGGLVPSLLLLLVTGIGAVVGSYAARNLAGQHRLGRFAVLEVIAVFALSVAVVAPSLVLACHGKRLLRAHRSTGGGPSCRTTTRSGSWPSSARQSGSSTRS